MITMFEGTCITLGRLIWFSGKHSEENNRKKEISIFPLAIKFRTPKNYFVIQFWQLLVAGNCQK